MPTLILLGLGLWEWQVAAGNVSRLFYPAPSSIVRKLIIMILEGELFVHLVASLTRLSLGLAFGGTTGLLLGLAMGWSRKLRVAIDPLVAAVHPVSKIAILPLIMIIFGIGEASKIVVVSMVTFFPMLINTMAGVRQINPIHFEVAQNYRASTFKVFTRVILPGSLPMILTGLRLALNVALLLTIAVELVASRTGLGNLIWFSWQTLRTEQLYATLIVTSALGIGFNIFVKWLTKRVVPWHVEREG